MAELGDLLPEPEAISYDEVTQLHREFACSGQCVFATRPTFLGELKEAALTIGKHVVRELGPKSLEAKFHLSTRPIMGLQPRILLSISVDFFIEFAPGNTCSLIIARPKKYFLVYNDLDKTKTRRQVVCRKMVELLRSSYNFDGRDPLCLVLLVVSTEARDSSTMRVALELARRSAYQLPTCTLAALLQWCIDQKFVDGVAALLELGASPVLAPFSNYSDTSPLIHCCMSMNSDHYGKVRTGNLVSILCLLLAFGDHAVFAKTGIFNRAMLYLSDADVGETGFGFRGAVELIQGRQILAEAIMKQAEKS